MALESELTPHEGGQPRSPNPQREDDQFADSWNLEHWSPEFAADARRQSLLIANSPDEMDVMAFIESLTDEVWSSLDAEEERAATANTGPTSTTDDGELFDAAEETAPKWP